MFGWLFGKRKRDEELLVQLVKAAAEGSDIAKIRQAIATISSEPLPEDQTELSGSAASVLARKLADAAILGINDDDDRFIVGLFAFVFSDHFSRLAAGNFELAATFAVMRTLGAEEFGRCFAAIVSSHRQMIEANPKQILAIGQNCAAWARQPSQEKFDRLSALMKLFREYVKEA